MKETAPLAPLPIEVRLSQARQVFSLGRYPEALPLLEALVHDRPAYADIHNMLGVSHHHVGQWARAETAFRQALKLNAQYTEAAMNLAVLLNDTGRYEEARVLYRDALARLSHEKNAMDPLVSAKIANMHAGLAEAYREANRPQEAIAEYQRALQLRPSFADIRHALAGVLMDTGDVPSAIEALHQAIEDRPNYLAARVRLGHCFVLLQQTDKAVETFEGVLAIEADHADAKRGLRRARGQLGEEEP